MPAFASADEADLQKEGHDSLPVTPLCPVSVHGLRVECGFLEPDFFGVQMLALACTDCRQSRVSPHLSRGIVSHLHPGGMQTLDEPEVSTLRTADAQNAMVTLLGVCAAFGGK